jgi:glycyl-tRNA synthetase beta chain
MIQGQDFAGVLATLAGLRDQVDAFFDQVLVMADDVDVRRNRLMLLYRLHGLFANVADISRLQAGVGTARD